MRTAESIAMTASTFPHGYECRATIRLLAQRVLMINGTVRTAKYLDCKNAQQNVIKNAVYHEEYAYCNEQFG